MISELVVLFQNINDYLTHFSLIRSFKWDHSFFFLALDSVIYLMISMDVGV